MESVAHCLRCTVAPWLLRCACLRAGVHADVQKKNRYKYRGSYSTRSEIIKQIENTVSSSSLSLTCCRGSGACPRAWMILSRWSRPSRPIACREAIRGTSQGGTMQKRQKSDYELILSGALLYYSIFEYQGGTIYHAVYSIRVSRWHHTSCCTYEYQGSPIYHAVVASSLFVFRSTSAVRVQHEYHSTTTWRRTGRYWRGGGGVQLASCTGREVERMSVCKFERESEGRRKGDEAPKSARSALFNNLRLVSKNCFE